MERSGEGAPRRLARGAPGYPDHLMRLADPPEALYVAGIWPQPPGVAVVGSRACTPAGRRLAADLAAAVAACGLPVVSGLARGIDAAAHAGALEAGGPTVAVLGGGLDRIYPPEHAGLAARVRQAGALVSEWPAGTPPRPWHFPRRNRVLAALARVVVVVEASERSGALITARHALDLGLDVLAVPGFPGAPLSRGTNGLIKCGAGLVEGPEDILAALGLPAPRPRSETRAARETSAEEALVLEVLANGPVTADEVTAATRLPAGRVAAILMALEIGGLVEPPAGQTYYARGAGRGRRAAGCGSGSSTS